MTLKERVEQSGIRYKKLAELLGVRKDQISQWLSGSRNMPENIKKDLVKVLEKVERALQN